MNINSCLLIFFFVTKTKGSQKDQRAGRLLCSHVFFFHSISFLFFLHSDILDLAYLKSLILKTILFARMCNGRRAVAPRGASSPSRGTRGSSPGLLPRRCWHRYRYCKRHQGAEMRCSGSATSHWPKGHSFADTLGQNRSFHIRSGSVLGFGSFGWLFFRVWFFLFCFFFWLWFQH